MSFLARYFSSLRRRPTSSSSPRRLWWSCLCIFRCSVRWLILLVSSAIWTSGEPVSPSLVAYSVRISFLTAVSSGTWLLKISAEEGTREWNPRDGRLRVQHASLSRLVAGQRFTVPRAADPSCRSCRRSGDLRIGSLGALILRALRDPGVRHGYRLGRLILPRHRRLAVDQVLADRPAAVRGEEHDDA